MTLASVDLRHIEGCGVGRLVKSIVVAAAGSDKEEDMELDCLTMQIHFVVPALAGATAEFLLHDADDKVVYASGEKAESLTHVINVQRALCGIITLRVECSAAQAGGATFSVVIYYV